MELTLENISEQDTARIGKSMAPLLFPGAFIALFGDLGSGKTTFTKAVAEGLGIDNIQSPTFTIVREHGGRLSLLHFDAYRLSSEDELYAIGFDDYLSRPAVIIMEWCENVPGALPSERLELHITGSGAEARTSRIHTLRQKIPISSGEYKMLMLSLSTSGPIASAAVIKDGQVLSREVGGHGRTHSETIMPLCEKALQTAGYTPKNMDAFGVDAGPGSFTGVRIGICAANAMAAAFGKPVAAASSLEGLLYGIDNACALLDCRNGNGYAMVKYEGFSPEPMAVVIERSAVHPATRHTHGRRRSRHAPRTHTHRPAQRPLCRGQRHNRRQDRPGGIR